MRLSPVMLAVIAFAGPIGTSLPANGQNNPSELSTETLKVPRVNNHSVIVNSQSKDKNQLLVSQPELIVPTTTFFSSQVKDLKAMAVEVNTYSNYKSTNLKTPKISQILIQPRDPNDRPGPDFPPLNPQQTPLQTPLPNPAPSQTPQIQQSVPRPQTNPGTLQFPQNSTPRTGTPTQQTPLPRTGTPTQQKPLPGTPTQQNPFPGTPTQQNPGTGTETPIPGSQPTTQQQNETRVLVSEVQIRTQQGQPLTQKLEDEVYRAIRTLPGRTTTRSQLQEDINSVFATGFFSDVRAVPEDTPLGVRVSFVVQANPILKKVSVQANGTTGVPSVLPPGTVDQIFQDQYGTILNLRQLQEAIKRLNKRYQDQGYVLAQVVGSPQVGEDGTVTLQVAEGVVENIKVRFRNKQGEDTDAKGNPIKGRTQAYIVTREVELKPGKVFNRNLIQRDLQRVFGLGLFEDVNVSLDPGTDPSKVDVVVNVVERNSGSIAAGAGVSSASGLFGTISYQQQNLNGRNQKLGAELELGQRDFLFDLRYTDPWIGGDPYRTSYTANVFRRRTISLIFDGGKNNVYLPNGDRPRVLRLGGGITFSRPLSRNVFKESEWTASAGLQYQRVSIRDADGNLNKRDALGNNLSFSGTGSDDLTTLQLGLLRDRRDNALRPTKGSLFRVGLEQSVPIGTGSIFLTRVQGSYSQYLPVKFTHFSKGPQTIALSVRGGSIFGDLPPYEAFSLGGSNSVRGYDEGDLGSGRSFVQATAEYRFPVFSVIGGVLFFDAGTDLGTGKDVPGDPAGARGKPGSGYGYGLGVRVQSPLGPIRVDYGLNADGKGRFHFGIGERF